MEQKLIELSIQVGNVLMEIRQIKDDVADHENVLYSGNSSILVRLSNIEKDTKDVLKRIEDIEESDMEIRAEDRKARWNFFLLLIIATVGWITAILTWLTENQFMKWVIDTIS